ncbi:MAG TPA: hypothetical protein VMD28_04795, partial [Acidimicrobiales bacterium]|nr:hypothetical protein [Acidimicrobiales bacterium]
RSRWRLRHGGATIGARAVRLDHLRHVESSADRRLSARTRPVSGRDNVEQPRLLITRTAAAAGGHVVPAY